MLIPEVLPDIPRLYTAIAEWLATVLLIIPFIKNQQHQAKNTIMMIGSLMVQIILQYFAAYLPLNLWIPGMLFNILWMYSVFRLSSKMEGARSIFYLIKAFIISELMASIGWQLYCLVAFSFKVELLWVEIVVVLGVYVVIFSIIYSIESQFVSTKFSFVRTRYLVGPSIFTGIIVFLMSNIGFVLNSTSYHLGNSWAIFFVRTIANLSGVAIMYAYQFILIDQIQKNEFDAMNQLFYNQYQQYKSYAQSTSYINRKAHDLKHQMNIIMSEEDIMKRSAYLSELRDAIDLLNSKIETGNGVLDTILTQKNIYCSEHAINFTCMANGHLLHALEIMDVCALFGNALDNAIEHVEKIADIEKRLINLRLTNRGKMVLLRIENYCIDQSLTSDIIPETTKQNDDYLHGYGMKSIQSIAKKYQGNVSWKVEDHWFVLRVLFPVSGK